MRHLRVFSIVLSSIHQTCWKNNVKFSVYNPCSTTKDYDPCVLFKNKQSGTDGSFIGATLLGSKQQCDFVIHVCASNRLSRLYKIEEETYNQPIHILESSERSISKSDYLNIEDTIIKLTYKKDKMTFHIFQFSNTVESIWLIHFEINAQSFNYQSFRLFWVRSDRSQVADLRYSDIIDEWNIFLHSSV